MNEFKFSGKSAPATKLAHFPIMLFAVIMGLGGLTLAYERLNLTLGLAGFIFEILRFITTAVFVVISAFYGAKIVKFKEQVKKEFSHPIKINFFAAFSISLFLLASMWREIWALHTAFFYCGLAFQTFITLYVVSFWINENQLIAHSNPAWFIPIVGNLIVPLASAQPSEAWWYYFSVGLFFWLVLFAIIFYRILFHDQLAQKFMPTLFIVIAPPAIAFLDYIKLGGEFDAFARILLNLTLFFALLIVFMWRNFLKLKFYLSWWAFTFPTAAASMAFLRAYEISGVKFYLFFGIAAFTALVFFITVVGFYTVKAIKNGEICTAES